MDAASEQLFECLQKCCVKCVQNPETGDVRQLIDLIGHIDDQSITPLFNYILFPLRCLISKFIKERDFDESMVISTMDCLRVLVKRVKLEFDVFADLYVSIFHLVDQQSNKERIISEDTKKHVVMTANQLITSLSSDCCAKILDTDFRPILGHSLSVLLNIAVVEKYRELREMSLQTMLTLIEKSISGEIRRDEVCAAVYAYFLPGLSSGLTKILTKDDKINRSLLVLSLRTFSLLLTLTLSTTDAVPVSNAFNGQQFCVERNEEWIANCSQKLVPPLKKVVETLISHQSVDVRKEVLIFSENVLTNCSMNFVQSSMEIIIDIPLSMLNDEKDEVKSSAHNVIKRLSSCVLSSRMLSDLILEQIHNFTSSFPRELRSMSEWQLKAKIDSLSGYVQCLGSSGINQVMSMNLYRQRLLQCLLDLAEFDYKNAHRFFNFINPMSVDSSERTQLIDYKHKRFKFFNELSTLKSLEHCCLLIGSLCDKNLLCDYVLDVCRGGNASSLFIINCISRGLEVTNFIVQLFEEYLSMLRFPKNANESMKLNANAQRAMFVCELLDGIPVFARICPEDYKQKFICKALYPLLAFTGTENSLIVAFANNSLNEVSLAFDYPSVNEMIAENVNYLISCATIKLRDVHSVDEAHIVVRRILTLSPIDNLRFFTGTVDELLLTLDSNHRSTNKHLFKIVHTFVKIINELCVHWQPMTTNSMPANTDVSATELRAKKINKFRNELDAFLLNKELAESCAAPIDEECTENSEENGEVEASDEKQAKKRELPVYATMIIKILNRCKHIASHPEAEIRILVLDCIALGIPSIKRFEDEVLPIAHQLWQPLVIRFKDKESMVVKMAFNCLLSMAETCKDFVRSRTLKDVLPTIVHYLKQQAKLSLKKDSPAYRFSLDYKMQLQLLEGLGDLAFNLGIEGSQLWQLIDATLPYLSSLQPFHLQQSALKTMTAFIRIDSNVCCYFLTQLYQPRSHGDDEDDDPSSRFESIRCDRWQKEDCKRNVIALLKLMQ